MPTATSTSGQNISASSQNDHGTAPGNRYAPNRPAAHTSTEGRCDARASGTSHNAYHGWTVGERISRISTISMTSANGNAPMNTSLSAIRSSFSVALMTKQLIPSGGVSNPISAPTTVTIPNQTRLRPIGSISGRKSGTTIRMIEAVSSSVPRKIIKST